VLDFYCWGCRLDAQEVVQRNTGLTVEPSRNVFESLIK